MPLNPTQMKNEVVAAIASVTGVAVPDITQEMWQKVCEAICAHIVANALVTGPVTVTSVSGVTTGLGVSGPGTGNLTAGTIT